MKKTPDSLGFRAPRTEVESFPAHRIRGASRACIAGAHLAEHLCADAVVAVCTHLQAAR